MIALPNFAPNRYIKSAAQPMSAEQIDLIQEANDLIKHYDKHCPLVVRVDDSGSAYTANNDEYYECYEPGIGAATLAHAVIDTFRE